MKFPQKNQNKFRIFLKKPIIREYKDLHRRLEMGHDHQATPMGSGRSRSTQALYQLAAVGITLFIALAAGMLTGIWHIYIKKLEVKNIFNYKVFLWKTMYLYQK